MGRPIGKFIALVQTVGDEGVGPVTDNVYRKEEMDVRGNYRDRINFSGQFLRLGF